MFEQFDERRREIVENLEPTLKEFIQEVMDYAYNKTNDEDLSWAYIQYEVTLLAGELKMEMLYHVQTLDHDSQSLTSRR